jgi:hypothetical protein
MRFLALPGVVPLDNTHDLNLRPLFSLQFIVDESSAIPLFECFSFERWGESVENEDGKNVAAF